MDPAELPLRDIHLPEPVAWWPPAPGWWVLAGALIVLAAVAAFAWRRHAALRSQRAALGELDAILAAFERDRDGHACARGLSRLARRLALASRGAAAASPTDAQWLALLAELGDGELPAPLERTLRVAPYSRAAANALAPEDYEAAAATMRDWIRTVPAGPSRPRRAA